MATSMDADEGTKLLTNPAPGALQLRVFCDAAAACRHSSALSTRSIEMQNGDAIDAAKKVFGDCTFAQQS